MTGFSRMPRMNMCASIRRARVASSNTAPILPISSLTLNFARRFHTWRTLRASNGLSRRSGNVVAWHPLDPATFAFRVALAEGLVLTAAMTAAIAQNPTFDIATAVRQIFADGLVVAYEL